ncbi:unnamed protein product [Toxocara canis]|uniref:HECT domain-containing protein n=1 Tax=Toxocara canis TaxID=6265 RepID=A0A183VD34_TOXCA|nr:unnamed protein product [Toxocara canis]
MLETKFSRRKGDIPGEDDQFFAALIERSHVDTEIPEALYKSLSDERQCHFEQLTVDFDCSPVEQFMRSIFDLGAASPELAIDFINGGISVKPNDSDVNVKMALSFIDSIPENVQNDKLVAMCGVMESLIGVLDPTFKSNRFIFCNESTIYG